MIQQKQRQKIHLLPCCHTCFIQPLIYQQQIFLVCDNLRHNTKVVICLRSAEVIFFGFFPSSTKIVRGILVCLSGLQISLLAYQDIPKISCMSFPLAELKTQLRGLPIDVYIIYTFSSLKMRMVGSRENDPALIASVTFPLLSTDCFLCPVCLQMLQAVRFSSLFVKIISLLNKSHSFPGYTKVVFSLISCQCICL